MDEIEKLYNAVSQQFDIGTIEEFKSKMATTDDRRKFYDVVSQQFDIGDYDSYEQRLGGATEVSAQGSAGTSQTLEQPSSSSIEPSSAEPEVEVDPSDKRSYDKYTQRATYADVPEQLEARQGVNLGDGVRGISAVDPDTGEVFNVLPEVEVTAPIPFSTNIKNTWANVKTQLEGVDDRLSLVAADTWENLIGKELATAWYRNVGDRDIEEVRAEAYEELARLEDIIRPVSSIGGSISRGDLVGAVGGIINSVAQLGTTAIVAVPTAGVGLYTEMVGQSIYDFNKTKADNLGLTIDELYNEGKAEFGVPSFIGILGGSLERVGFKGARQAIGAALSSEVGRKLLKAGLGTQKEGLTELLQHGLEQMNTTLANPDATLDDAVQAFASGITSEEGFESYLMGVAGSGVAAGAAGLGGKLIGRQNKQKVESATNTINAINEDLANPNLTPTARAVLEDSKRTATQEVSQAITEDTALEDSLPADVRNVVEGRLNDLEAIQEALQDPSVSETTKQALQQQAITISTEIDNLIAQTDDTQSEQRVESGVGEGETAEQGVQDQEGSTETVEAGGVLQNEEVVTQRTPEATAALQSSYDRLTEGMTEEQIDADPDLVRMRDSLQIPQSETAVQETETFIIPEQVEAVNTALQEQGFTPEQSTTFVQAIQTEEGRTNLKTERANRIREYWQSQQTLGVAQDPNQRAQQDLQFMQDLIEYAAVSIVDGTIRTANALADAVGIPRGDQRIQDAFEQGRAIQQQIQSATVTPTRTTNKAQIAQTTRGGIQGTEVVEISSKKALRDQLRMAQINARAGELEGRRAQRETQKQKADRVKAIKDTIRGYIKSFGNTDLFKGATVPANLVARLTDRLAKIQDTSPTAITQLMNFSEYLEKLVDDIEYDNKANKARSESKRIKGIAKSLKQQRDLQGTLQRFAALGANPIRIADLDRYNELAAMTIDRQGNIGISSMDLNAFVNEQETKYEAEQVRKEEAANEARREAALAHMQEIMDAEGIEGNASDFYDESILEYKPEGVTEDTPAKPETSKAKEQLEQMVTFNREGLPRKLDELNAYEQESLEALRGIPLTDLDVATLRKLNTAITNAVVNGDFISGTAEIVGRYKAGREAQSWLTQFNDQLNTIVQGTSERFWSLLPTRMKLDTNQLFRAISGKARIVGETLYEHVLGDVDRGYVRAKQFVDKSVSKALQVYDKHKMKSRDSFKVGTAVYLLNYETDGKWDNPQHAFDTKVNMIVESRDALQTTLETRRDNLNSVDRRRYQRDLDRLNEIIKELDGIKTPEQLQEEFLNPGQQELYDHIISTWESKKEQTRELFQKLGTKFTESELYAPISYSNIVTSGVNVTQDIDIDDYTRPGAIDNAGKHVAERQNVTTLPTTKADDGTLVTRYLSLDAIRNFDKELSRRIADMETIDARIKAKYLLSNQEVKNAVDRGGKVNNHENLVWKTKLNIRDLSGISGFIKDYNHNLDAVVSQATRLFYRSTVGSVTQLVNQSVANIPSIIANTSFGSWSQATKLMGQLSTTSNAMSAAVTGESFTDLIMNSEASAYTRLESSAEEKMMNAVGDMENEMENSLKKGFSKVNKMVGDITYQGLTAGDNLNTKNSWLAGYIKSLKDQGVIKKSSEFTIDMLREHATNPNLKAAHAADGIASSINATMRKASRAETTKARSTSQRVFNSLFGNPLKSFATSQNMEARLAFNNLMRNDYTGRDIAIIGGYIANVFLVSAAVRYIWSLGFQAAGVAIAGAIVGGDDEDKKAEERRLAELELTKAEEKSVKTNRKIISMMAQGISNVLFGSQPVWLEAAGTAALDVAYSQLIVPHFESGKSAKDRARTPVPSTLFFTSTDNVFGVGVLDNYAQIYNSVEKLATAPLPKDEEAVRKIQSMRVANAFLSTGALGADMKRLSQQTLISLERTLKDGYYKMPKSYGVIKEAVNEYGIRPLQPFNRKTLYLEDENGNVEAVQLSENDIDRINKELGKEMVNQLPDLGYGKSVKAFNKQGLTTEEINEDMAALRRDATRDVIEKMYGKYLTTQSRLLEQEEDE